MTPCELSDAERAAIEAAIERCIDEDLARTGMPEAERGESVHSDLKEQAAFRAGRSFEAALAARDEAPPITDDALNVFAAVLTALETHAPETGPFRPVAIIDAGRKALAAARGAGKLPGDAQRRSLVDADLDPTEPQELKDAFRIMRQLMCSRGGEQLVLDRVIRPYGLTVVRDTERHEPAEEIDDAIHIAVDGGRQTLCGQDARPRNSVGPRDPRPDGMAGCWMCLQVADEVAGDKHADVLAKALDQLFLNPRGAYTAEDSREQQMLEEVKPTLRALGYPKEGSA
jgi:hypothetical protein